MQFHESDTIEMRWHMAVIIGKDIIKRYNKVVLGPCSFTVEQGKTLAVLGPSGSGKSTLFKACAHLLEIEGELEIKDLKRCVVVFDEPNCLNTLNLYDDDGVSNDFKKGIFKKRLITGYMKLQIKLDFMTSC